MQHRATLYLGGERHIVGWHSFNQSEGKEEEGGGERKRGERDYPRLSTINYYIWNERVPISMLIYSDDMGGRGKGARERRREGGLSNDV